MITTSDYPPNRRDDRPARLQQLSDSEKEGAVADALRVRIQQAFAVEVHAVDYSSRFFERGSFRSPAKIECRVSAIGSKDDETDNLDLIRRLPDADLGAAIASQLSVRSGESYDVELLRKRYASDGTKSPKFELAFLVATLDESPVTSEGSDHPTIAEHPTPGGGELERAIAALTDESAPRRHADGGKRCGVYTILQKTPGVLRPILADDAVVLYVGMSTSLSAREFDTHFDSAQTGFSTVRRSLGAILKDELRLTALARGHGRSKNDFVNFRFEAEGEERLTAWMRQHLSVNTWPTNHYEALEKALIRELRPPLNLQKTNPKNDAIRSLRKLCADEARAKQTPMTRHSNLRLFLRTGLDILFVALNAPVQSHENRHWFSGRQSRFFCLLGRSGLTIDEVPRQTADEIVFGSVERNYKRASFGVVDLVPDLVETRSSEVCPTLEHAKTLLTAIREYKPRFVCVIHTTVRDALNESGLLVKPMVHGANGPLLKGCASDFYMNYFPNGNNKPDALKLEVFRQLRDRL